MTSLRIGITGHQTLTCATADGVHDEIAQMLQSLNRPLIGVTSLAAGSDQLFADCVIKAGGTLEVIVPCRNYGQTFRDPLDFAAFERFITTARHVRTLEFEEPSEEAFWAAGQSVVDRSEIVYAVWDGQQAGGLGGTADVVHYAEQQGRQVVILWPPGSART